MEEKQGGEIDVQAVILAGGAGAVIQMSAAAERLQGAAALQPVQAVQHGAVIADAGVAGGQHRAVAGDEVGALAVQMQAGEQGGHVDLRVGEKAVGLLVEADDHAGGVPPRHGADIIGDAVLLHTLGVDLGGVDETLQPGGGRAVQPGHARVLTGVAGGLQLQVRVEEGNAAEPYLVHEVLQIGVGGQGGVQLQMAAELLYAVGQTEQALGAVRRFQLMEADALLAQGVQRVVRQGLSAAEAVPAGQVQGQEEQQDAGKDDRADPPPEAGSFGVVHGVVLPNAVSAFSPKDATMRSVVPSASMSASVWASRSRRAVSPPAAKATPS